MNRADEVWIEAHESFVKQTARNRCVIATANGPQTLSVPIVHDGARGIRDIRISNHGKWRSEHWNALATAYGESPFFDYYVDDLRPFFKDEWEYLFDYNLAIMHKMLELLDIPKEIRLTERWGEGAEEPEDGKSVKPYYQVYARKNGFLPDMSILDLLFNMGNEAVLWL